MGVSPHLVALLILASLCSALGQVFFKYGAVDRSAFIEFINPWLMIGLFFYATCAVLWIYCMSKVPLVAAFPFTVLAIMLTLTAGIYIFGETTSSTYWYGVALVLTGLFFISR
jgi:undecaprenyl phosphate-alpha-L-ara4N flippase subunit ArnE